METKRLYRSRTDKIIAGVCGGMAEYFDVDPVIMRVLFVLLAFFGGSGFILYLASIFIIPKKPLNIENSLGIESSSGGEDDPAPGRQNGSSGNARTVFGIVMIIFGALILLGNLGVLSFFHFWHLSAFVFPILLILIGMAIIYYKQAETQPQSGLGQENSSAGATVGGETPSGQEPPRRRMFRRSSNDKKLFGVCGGLANYFSLDPTVVRILYVILCLASFGAGIVLYLTLALVAPDDRYVPKQQM
ncbi:MAG: PspC domain-containing protein [Bacteroidota bacterium]|nr:PspC domain-containing protein [Bacteroidota bacterium]